MKKKKAIKKQINEMAESIKSSAMPPEYYLRVFPIGHEPPETKKVFRPTQELIEFAEWFSKNYMKLEPGNYFSKTKKFYLEFKNQLTNDYSGEPINTIVRVARTSEKIECDQNIQNGEFKKDFAFYLIIWCVAMLTVKPNDFKGADKKAALFCFKQGKSKKQIVTGMRSLFEQSIFCENHNKRTENLFKLSDKK